MSDPDQHGYIAGTLRALRRIVWFGVFASLVIVLVLTTN